MDIQSRKTVKQCINSSRKSLTANVCNAARPPTSDAHSTLLSTGTGLAQHLANHIHIFAPLLDDSFGCVAIGNTMDKLMKENGNTMDKLIKENGSINSSMKTVIQWINSSRKTVIQCINSSRKTVIQCINSSRKTVIQWINSIYKNRNTMDEPDCECLRCCKTSNL